jgi:hypothetical protein
MTSYIGGDGAGETRPAGAARALPRHDPAVDLEQGGDPACWLNRVCNACGRFIDDPLADACPTCGAARE